MVEEKQEVGGGGRILPPGKIGLNSYLYSFILIIAKCLQKV